MSENNVATNTQPPVATTNNNQDNNNNQGGGFSKWIGPAIRMIIIFFALRTFMSSFNNNNQNNNNPNNNNNQQQQGLKGSSSLVNNNNGNNNNGIAICLYPRGLPISLKLYLASTNDKSTILNHYSSSSNNKLSSSSNNKEEEENVKLIWEEDNLYFDDRESNNRILNLTISNSLNDSFYSFYKRLFNNETLYFHVLISPNNLSSSKRIKYSLNEMVHVVHPFNKFIKIKKNKKRNLLFNNETINDDNLNDLNDNLNGENKKKEEEVSYISHYDPNIYLQIVDFQENLAINSIPPHIVNSIHFLENQPRNNNNNRFYYPIIYFNEFWSIKDYLININNTQPLSSINFKIELSSTSNLKFQFLKQMEFSFKMQESFGTSMEGDHDEVKRMLLETNPYFLGLTLFVSLLHSIFDFLAFKNDIQFYKDKSNVEGLSIKTIFINCFFQTVIFLYLFDNETSWMILISTGIGVLIEYWKITKVVDVSIKKTRHFPYFIEFKDKSTYVSSKTKEYDDEAIRYLSYVIYPLFIGYSIYSLMYNEFKSWYSFVLSTIVGFVYLFGFLNMIPQVYINYKLKSVAHMPWKTFIYKALNTFIDDLFAFIIKMPTLHRLACFRDDIIFLIYLYQRWIYKVDLTRANEFGQVFEGPTTNDDNSNNNKVEEIKEENIITSNDKLEDKNLRNRHKSDEEIITEESISNVDSTLKEKTD
ncbi:hypothetical protein ABK040_010493 [Willaertia magna]